MLPYERKIYTELLKNHLEEENKRMEEAKNK